MKSCIEHVSATLPERSAALDEFPSTSTSDLPSGEEEAAILLVIEGRIGRRDITGLCERLRSLLGDRLEATVICDVGRLAKPDAVVVDALARLQLTARRFGSRVTLRDPCEELVGLLDLAGLAEVVGPADLEVQAGGKPEQREPAGGVEEEADPGEPVA